MTDSLELTQNQAQLLAHTLHEIRPEWGITSMMKILWENRGKHPFPDLALAAVKAATVPTNRTPAVIFLPGKHWATEKEELGPWSKTFHIQTPCLDHPEQEGHNCRPCWADVKVGDRPETHIGKHFTPGETP